MSKPQKTCSLCYLCAKNVHNRWKFDKVLTKISLHSFLETRCRTINSALTPPLVLLLCVVTE